jgi:hypothetical protein
VTYGEGLRAASGHRGVGVAREVREEVGVTYGEALSGCEYAAGGPLEPAGGHSRG